MRNPLSLPERIYAAYERNATNRWRMFGMGQMPEMYNLVGQYQPRIGKPKS